MRLAKSEMIISSFINEQMTPAWNAEYSNYTLSLVLGRIPSLDCIIYKVGFEWYIVDL